MRSQYTSYVLSKFNDNKHLVNELKMHAEAQVKGLLLILFAALLTSLYTLRDSFQCDGGTDRDCEDIRKNLSCKSTLVSPMRSTMKMTIGTGSDKSNNVKVTIFCGWETAQS